MRGDWPHETVVNEINRVMGTQQRDTRMPHERLHMCTTLYAVVLRELELPDVDQPRWIKFLENFLKAVTERYSSHRPVAASRELLGFTRHNYDEIQRILSEENHGLTADTVMAGYRSKTVRLYLAGRELEPPVKSRATQSKQRDVLANAMATSVHDLLGDHWDEARSIVTKLGFHPFGHDGDDATASPSLSPSRTEVATAGRRNPPTNFNNTEQRHTPPPGNIPRTGYHRTFDRHVAEQYKCIVLSGLPGIGKSWLADALTMEHAPEGETVPIIEYVQGAPTPESVKAALDDCGVKADPENVWMQHRRYLSQLLRDKKAPAFIILDNLDDLRGVGQLLPPRSQSIVVITCRVASHLDQRHAVIPVNWMTDTEATELVKIYLPTLSGEDASLFGTSLYGYPILIRHACTLFACQPMAINEFCKVVQEDIANLADSTETALRTRAF